MVKDTVGILIETLVKKTLRDIKAAPERSIRNLVDLALHFSQGRFQHRFFAIAQTMLQNESSPYYGLIQDTVAHVENQKLLRFGMNMGYNGCTLGARTIRRIEKREGYNIPWCLGLELEPQCLAQNRQRYQEVIGQGEDLGIHTWMLYAPALPQEGMSLAQAHPDSAFCLFCPPQAVEPSFLETAELQDNLMTVVEDSDGTAEACGLLRERGLLYSVYHIYGAADVPDITGGALLRRTQDLHPLFTGLLAGADCPIQAQQEVYNYILGQRNAPQAQTVAWELAWDSRTVDGIISQESCVAYFDAQGYLATPWERYAQPLFNMLQTDLPDILKRAFPKGTEA